MKPSTSALIGAVIAGGGWLSLPSVAFAAEPPALSARTVADQRARPAAQKSSDAACSADAHAHASSCTCARCASAQAD